MMDAPSDVAGWVVIAIIGLATVVAHVLLVLLRAHWLSRELMRALAGVGVVLAMTSGATVGYRFIGGPGILLGAMAPLGIAAMCGLVYFVASELGDALFERLSKGKS